MVGDFITLPLRLTARITESMMRVGVTLTGRTINAGGQVIKAVAGGSAPAGAQRFGDQQRTPPRGDGQATAAAPTRSETAPAQRQRTSEDALAASAEATAQATPTAPPPPAPHEHVSEEATLVEELAEPGAEGGAGASVEIAEPWEDYDQMTAKTIVARLKGCSAAELGVVELYEIAHRNRETVLAAVKRELKTAGRDGRTT